MSGRVLGTVSPDGEQDACEFACNSNGGDEFPAAELDAFSPKANGVEWPRAPQSPSRLDERAADGSRASLCNTGPLLALRARVLPGSEAEETLDGMRRRKTRDLINSGDKAHARDRTYAGHRHESNANGVLFGKLFQFLVCQCDLFVERIDHLRKSLECLRPDYR